MCRRHHARHVHGAGNNDNLKTAIDCFITQNLSEVPVLDRDGDMVGIVSAGALLKVCLPEYLRMSDLSPIVNFEPSTKQFGQRAEHLALRHSPQRVRFGPNESPGVSVVGEMTRRNASKCYVLNGKKLMGIIDLPVFLNKVFRE